jgi:hypothetical protein
VSLLHIPRIHPTVGQVRLALLGALILLWWGGYKLVMWMFT